MDGFKMIPYTPNRALRALAKWIKWRAAAERRPQDGMAAALARYWGRQAKP